MIRASMVSYTGADVYMGMKPMEFAEFWRAIVRIHNAENSRRG